MLWKRITLLFVTIAFCILLTAITCYKPPLHEEQNKDYATLDSLIRSSDRIIQGELITQTSESVTLQEGELITLVYQTYLVKSNFKGSADEGEEIHVAIPESLELFTQYSQDKVDFHIGSSYILFLKGRARTNHYPPQYGGTLWTPNGEPSIAILEREGNILFATTDRYLESIGAKSVPFSVDLQYLQNLTS